MRSGDLMSAARNRQIPEQFLHYPGSALVVALLADKWTIPVIHALARQTTTRTGELRRSLAGISQKMLTQTLRALEERRLVERTVFPVVPPRVEYRLTPLGSSLNGPLQTLCEWLKENGKDLERQATRSVRRRAVVGGED